MLSHWVRVILLVSTSLALANASAHPIIASPSSSADVIIVGGVKDKLEDMDISLHLRTAHMGPTLQKLTNCSIFLRASFCI